MAAPSPRSATNIFSETEPRFLNRTQAEPKSGAVRSPNRVFHPNQGSAQNPTERKPKPNARGRAGRQLGAFRQSRGVGTGATRVRRHRGGQDRTPLATRRPNAAPTRDPTRKLAYRQLCGVRIPVTPRRLDVVNSSRRRPIHIIATVEFSGTAVKTVTSSLCDGKDVRNPMSTRT
jgi:hypothetical protein